MDFLDKIGKTANETYKGTVEKTGRIAKITKKKISIYDNKSRIREIYEDIGRKVYEKHIREQDISIREDLNYECEKIDKLSNEIKELKQEILKSKNQKQCKRCYANIDISYSYCPTCGENQTNESFKERVRENLENADIKPENEEKKQIIEDELDD
ncbi:MAG: hypothetical protein LBL91_02645 [Lachnospiraceae bacterium]|jgi:hypothetical protein|nr:hypothetical protein [Lachnospiraceae bacterium]